MFHQCACKGVSASLVLPTICVHMCSVSAVSRQSSHASSGQLAFFADVLSMRTSGISLDRQVIPIYLRARSLPRRLGHFRLDAWSTRRFAPILIQVRPEPSLRLFDAPSLALSIVLDLVLPDLAQAE